MPMDLVAGKINTLCMTAFGKRLIKQETSAGAGAGKGG